MTVLTRAELEARKLRLEEQLHQVQSLPSEDDLLEELDEIDWLLGDR